jgi:hypothetical protein
MKAAATGMYCAPFLGFRGNRRETSRGEEWLRRVVRFFKGNPGLGVWKGADEPQWGKLPVPALVRVRSSTRKTPITHSDHHAPRHG